MNMLFKSFIYLLFLMGSGHVLAEKTLWDEMPKSADGRFNYFQKIDRQGVFQRYKEMRGTRLIFACVNAQVYYLYAYQLDRIKDESEAQDEANQKCAEITEISFDKSEPSIKLPLGTPILLRFQKDYSAYEGYLGSQAKWEWVAQNDDTTLFIQKGKQITTSEGYKGSWILSNFNKISEFGSVVSMREFDCKMNRFRITKLIAYSDKYGQGKKIQASPTWTLSPPGTLLESLVDAACK